MKLVIFDGNSIINRAFYGIRPLINSKGVNTNSIYGFLNILLKFIEEEKPEYLCVAFDLKAPTFRKKLYNEYKAQRKGMPDELAAQLPILKELLLSMNITILEQEGYEADDIIGTIAACCTKQNIKCIIATGDKDDLQLATKDITVKLTTTKQTGSSTDSYNEKEVIERYGVTPNQLIDVKALMGDASDNIPGVAGIGEKTALKLIIEYQSLENLYNNLDTVKESIRLKLEKDKEMAFLSKTLGTICLDVPIKCNVTECILENPLNENFAKYITELEFSSILNRLNIESKAKKEAINVITKDISINNLIPLVKNDFYFIYSTEDEVLFCFIDGIVYKTNENIMLLKNIFEDEKIKKYSHDVKPLVLHLLSNNILFKGLEFDTAIAGYLLNPSATTYDYKLLSAGYSEYDVIDNITFMASFKEITKKMDELLILNNMKDLFVNIELKLINVLANMEYLGFKVNKDKLKKFSIELDELLIKLTKDIYYMADEEFNINSPKQLGNILFDKLELPVAKKTKTGYSTNADVLNKLCDKHEIINLILEYRQYSKLKSTYADGLLKVVAEDGRIHSSFNQLITQTGRISSTEPNLQNIPIRSKMGAKIREMFEAENNDYVLIDADYSQIELRVLASISKDTNMIKAFKNNEDIHTQTAAEVFNIEPSMITPLIRTRAKAVNFGIVYGIGEYSLSQDIKVSRKQARIYIDNYLNHFNGVDDYMKTTIQNAYEAGYVTTLFGRRRYIPELKVSNKNLKAFGERVAMNAPIQGSAADIIKIAMVKVYENLLKNKLKAKLILQVHDELIIECPKIEVDKVKDIIVNEMQNAAKLLVPLTVDVNTGFTWFDAK